MPEQHTLARALHDAGLAAWFGGALMGAVGLNGASQEVSDHRDRTRVANAGWGRWTLTGVALATTAYSRTVGRKVMEAEAAEAAAARSNGSGSESTSLPVEDATQPAPDTNGAVAKVQKQLDVLHWAVPVLTGATLLVNAKMSEQQRLTPQQPEGFLGRVNAKT